MSGSSATDSVTDVTDVRKKEEGSSATDSVTDVTDVTDVRKKEEGRFFPSPTLPFSDSPLLRLSHSPLLPLGPFSDSDPPTRLP